MSRVLKTGAKVNQRELGDIMKSFEGCLKQLPPKVKHRDEIENMLPVLERATFTAKLLSTENYDFFCLQRSKWVTCL